MASENGKIFAAIAACMNDISAVGKTKKNQGQGYMFRGIDEVYNAVHPILSMNKVVVVPEVIDMKREMKTSAKGAELTTTILTVKHTFYADDGSSISAITVGEGMDSGDKSSNKAMSAAYKYAMFETLCIPTEMIDSEVDSPEPMATKNESGFWTDPAQIPDEKLVEELDKAFFHHAHAIQSYLVSIKWIYPGDVRDDGTGYRALLPKRARRALENVDGLIQNALAGRK
jgi:hypothetical protein